MPLERQPEELRHDPVGDPDAAVRDGLPDRPRRVGPVNGDRPALRPAGEHVRERRDADRSGTERAVLVGRDQALVDVEAAGRGGRRRGADRGLRAQDLPAMVEERDALRGEVDDDPRRDLLDLDLPGRDPGGHPVRALRDLDQVLPWLAAGIQAGATDPEDRRHPVDVQLPESGKGRSPRPAVDRGVRTDDRRIRELGRAEPLDRAGGAGLSLRRGDDRRGGLLFRAMTAASRQQGEPDHGDGSRQPHPPEITAVKKVCRFRDYLPTTKADGRTSHYCEGYGNDSDA